MLGYGAISEHPIGALDAADEAAPAGIAAVYLSTVGYTTRPTDSLPNQHFAGRVTTALAYERSVLGGNLLGGRIVSLGDAEIENGDGGLDTVIANYAVDGRRVVIRVGGYDRSVDGIETPWSYDDFGIAFDGTALGWEASRQSAKLRLRDNSYLFDVPLQANTYAGSGGTEGGEDLKGKPKPLGFGYCSHVPAVLVDPANLVYQVHDGPIYQALVVYDRGVALIGGSAPTWDTANGRFTLAAAPAGFITASFIGAAAHLVDITVVCTTADIIREIATDYVLIAEDDLDTASFASLDERQPANVSLWINSDERPSAADAIDRLMVGIGGHWGYNREGQLSVGRIDLVEGDAQKRFTSVEILDIEMLPLPWELPFWRFSVGWGRNWNGPTSDVAGSVPDATRTFLASEIRVAAAADTTVQLRHLLARDSDVIEGLFASATDAESEADRLLDLYSPGSLLIRISVGIQPFTLEIGDPVEVVFSRWGLGNGRTFRVVGIRETAPGGEMDLTLYSPGAEVEESAFNDEFSSEFSGEFD